VLHGCGVNILGKGSCIIDAEDVGALYGGELYACELYAGAL